MEQTTEVEDIIFFVPVGALFSGIAGQSAQTRAHRDRTSKDIFGYSRRARSLAIVGVCAMAGNERFCVSTKLHVSSMRDDNTPNCILSRSFFFLLIAMFLVMQRKPESGEFARIRDASHRNDTDIRQSNVRLGLREDVVEGPMMR